MLKDYFGPRLPAAQRDAGAARKRELLSAAMQSFRSPACRQALGDAKVAIVGGGFAGMAAAWFLGGRGAKVTVYEARAEVGGRVETSTKITPNARIEGGAEFIGAIHPMSLALAKAVGLTMRERSVDACYQGVGLQLHLWVDGDHLSHKELEQVNEALEARVLRPISSEARRVGKPAEPWNESAAVRDFDKMTVADKLQKLIGAKPTKKPKPGEAERLNWLLWRLMEIWFVNDHVSAMHDFSYLALLCLVKGGQLGDDKTDPDLMGYWHHLETYRCAEGNQALATRMAEQLAKSAGSTILRSTEVLSIDVKDAPGGVTVTSKPASGAKKQEKFDWVVVAVPPTVPIPITPAPAAAPLHMGAAAKFFSNVNGRFWLAKESAPSGHSSTMGQVWEATDNQAPPKSKDIDLAVFAGATIPKLAKVEAGLTELYPTYKANRKGPIVVRDWSAIPFIKTGYAAPKKGQLLTSAKQLNAPHAGRLYFAGEHTATDSFGYMEGALRSGHRVAEAIMGRVCNKEQTRTTLTRTAELGEPTRFERELDALVTGAE
jgi:monoamine oxidase